MAKLLKTPMMGRDKFNKTVTGVPDSQYDDTFDSSFYKSVDSDKNCTLKIWLRIFYRQVNPWEVTSPMIRVIANSLGVPVPSGASVGYYGDADDTPHLIKNWSGTEWSNFIKEVKRQANLWDGRFWLIPPDDFSLLDIVENSWTAKSGRTITRPNVKCEFNFEIAPTRSLAHKSVDVVNILGPGFFRSHSRLYNTNDAAIRSLSDVDWQANTVNTQQPTITHEIGHALGLPHIGISRSLSHCGLALVFGKLFQDDAIPGIYKGGSNASVCYGTNATAGDINNIMGGGSAFSQENAKPWLDRLPHHFNLPVPEFTQMMAGLGKWKISLKDVPPMGIVFK